MSAKNIDKTKRPESTNPTTDQDPAAPIRMLFMDENDICDPWGKIAFGANSLRLIDNARGLPPVRVRGVAPNPDGSWTVYGHLHPERQGSHKPWSIVRARTWNGIDFECAEKVFTSTPGHWYVEGLNVYRPFDGKHFCFKWTRSEAGKGHEFHVFGSDDGASWRPLKDGPLYHDHDAFSVIWDEPSGQFVNFQHTYQVWRKEFVDNAGPDVRRAFHIRTSPDGINWTPSGDASLRGEKMPLETLYAPDENDPPEDEFYLFVVFPYCGRYVGMMKHYIPNPVPIQGKGWHGPHCFGEWWVARDWRKWQRPFRDVFAPGEASDVILAPPMDIGDRHLWAIGGKIYGLPKYGIFYAGSMSNSRFTTHPFIAPETHINILAEFNYHADPSRGFQGQSYLMVEALDESGNTIEGYEKEKCLFLQNPGRARLLWRNSGELKTLYPIRGRKIRLRCHMRDARVYALFT